MSFLTGFIQFFYPFMKNFLIVCRTAIASLDKHAVAVAVEAVTLADGMSVCIHYKFVPGES